MTMGATREHLFMKLFLSAYENGSWADADLLKPDATDRTNPAVDTVAKRKSDGMTLAIEHTIIEPFVQEKEDYASFSEADFFSIEKDTSLVVPGIWIEVFVPVGTSRSQPPGARKAIVQSLHDWVKSNRLVLPKGRSQQRCPISGAAAETLGEIALTVRVTPLGRGEPGALHIRRQQIDNNLGDVVERALEKKLPKLVNTPADRRILMLERQHMTLLPEGVLAEIERRRAWFPELAKVDEIWIIETILYGTAFGGTYLGFELYENGHVTRRYDFKDEKPLTRFEGGLAEVVSRLA
jgi:hypothetical protein